MPTQGEGGGTAAPRGVGGRWLWVAVAAIAVVVIVVLIVVGGDDGGQRSVPSVVGLAENTAAGTLVANGFSTQVKRERSTQANGTVLAQDPDPGSDLDEGDVVVLTVSSAPGGELAPAEQPSGPVEVPDVVGDEQVLAGAALERLGLVPDTRPVERDKECCVVVEQQPRPGTTLEAGDSVMLSVAFVAAGRLEIPVPDLEGLSASAARTTARELGFTMTTVERPAPSPDFAGKIVGQNPRAGADVPEFSRLKLFVGA